MIPILGRRDDGRYTAMQVLLKEWLAACLSFVTVLCCNEAYCAPQLGLNISEDTAIELVQSNCSSRVNFPAVREKTVPPHSWVDVATFINDTGGKKGAIAALRASDAVIKVLYGWVWEGNGLKGAELKEFGKFVDQVRASIVCLPDKPTKTHFGCDKALAISDSTLDSMADDDRRAFTILSMVPVPLIAIMTGGYANAISVADTRIRAEDRLVDELKDIRQEYLDNMRNLRRRNSNIERDAQEVLRENSDEIRDARARRTVFVRLKEQMICYQ